MVNKITTTKRLLHMTQKLLRVRLRRFEIHTAAHSLLPVPTHITLHHVLLHQLAANRVVGQHINSPVTLRAEMFVRPAFTLCIGDLGVFFSNLLSGLSTPFGVDLRGPLFISLRDKGLE